MVKIALPENLTGIGSLMSYTNEVTNNGVGIVMPFVLVIMVMVIAFTKTDNAAQSITLGCFVGVITSLVLMAVGITPLAFVLMWGFLMIIAALFIKP